MITRIQLKFMYSYTILPIRQASQLHVFSMEGWLPPPYQVTSTAYPTPEEGVISFLFIYLFIFVQNNRKGSGNDYLDPFPR